MGCATVLVDLVLSDDVYDMLCIVLRYIFVIMSLWGYLSVLNI